MEFLRQMQTKNALYLEKKGLQNDYLRFLKIFFFDPENFKTLFFFRKKWPQNPKFYFFFKKPE